MIDRFALDLLGKFKSVHLSGLKPHFFISWNSDIPVFDLFLHSDSEDNSTASDEYEIETSGYEISGVIAAEIGILIGVIIFGFLIGNCCMICGLQLTGRMECCSCCSCCAPQKGSHQPNVSGSENLEMGSTSHVESIDA